MMPPPIVAILGPVRIVGATGPPPATGRRAETDMRQVRCTALIAYLATHPGATIDRLTTEIWPDITPTSPTVYREISRARAWLASTPGGQPYLPRVTDGLYRLHPAITTDWDLLQRLTGPDPTTTPTDRLVHALGIPRGPAITHPWARPLRALIHAHLDTTLTTLTQRATTTGDEALAVWVEGRRQLVLGSEPPVMVAGTPTIARHG